MNDVNTSVSPADALAQLTAGFNAKEPFVANPAITPPVVEWSFVACLLLSRLTGNTVIDCDAPTPLPITYKECPTYRVSVDAPQSVARPKSQTVVPPICNVTCTAVYK